MTALVVPLCCLVDRFVVQPNELLCLQCNHGIGSSVVICEFDFVDTGSPILDHRANLAAHQALVG